MVEGFRNTEVGVIPEDWKIQKLGELANIIGGGTPSSFNRSYWNGNINWFTPTEIGKHKYTYESLRKITKVGYDNCSAKMLPIGTILLTTRAGIGDLSILKTEGCTNQGFQSFVSVDSVDNEFLYYLLSTLKSIFLQNASGSTFLEISPNKLRAIQVPLPPTKAEQTAIATALNDADALISSLEKLIAKKKAIKQGAMQELLKPKEGWETKTIHELADNKKELFDDGDWIESEHITNTGIRLIQTGNIGVGCYVEKETKKYIFEKSFQLLKCKPLLEGDLLICRLAEPAGRACVLPNIGETKVVTSVDVTIFRPRPVVANRVFLSNIFSTSNWFSKVGESVGGTTHKRISRSSLGKIQISLPSIDEQNHIAQILSDMDNEILILEGKLEKQKQLKQGMIQSLLTGKIRLKKQQELPQTIELKLEKSLNHNHYFEDAVLISAIVNNFYSEKYILGRKKVQKLLYLLRRKQEVNTNAFKRKAAGPYADEVRYKGGEPIAKNKKYINISSNKLGSIFSKGEQISEALGYIEKWEMHSDIEWLVSQFKFKTVDQLELLATIDMAICDLEKENKAVSLENIKNLIKSDKEWRAKLERKIFSDSNIQLAIRQCSDLFEQQI